MNINKLIRELEKIKEKHGNLPVDCFIRKDAVDRVIDMDVMFCEENLKAYCVSLKTSTIWKKT